MTAINTGNKRLDDILMEVKNGKDFHDFITYEDEEILNQEGFQKVLYLYTENDQLNDTAFYEGEPMPYYLDNNGRADMMKELIYNFDIKTNLDIFTGYYMPNYGREKILVDSIYFDGDYEIEGAEILYLLFDGLDWEQAENIAKEYNIESYYYHNQIIIACVLDSQEFLEAITAEYAQIDNEDTEEKEQFINDVSSALNGCDQCHEDTIDNTIGTLKLIK